MTIMPAAGLTTRPKPTYDEPPLVTAQRAAHLEALRLLGELESQLAKMELPDFWEDPYCQCAPTRDLVDEERPLQVVTLGYQQWCAVDGVDFDEDTIHAYTDGWDDMSDDGSASYLECNPHNGGCGAVWAIPEELEWD